MVNVFYKGKFTVVPSTWDELTGQQLQEVAMIMVGPYLEEVKRIRLLKVLMGWSWWRMALTMGMLRFWELPALNSGLKKLTLFGNAIDRTARLADAAEELTAFLFEKNAITKNLVPKYKSYYGPADKLANVRMGEFCFSENYYLLWKSTGEMQHLNMLIACLWRKGKRTAASTEAGDHRYPFNPVVLTANAKQVDKWPLQVKLAMGLIYAGMRQDKIAANPKVFSSESEGGETVFGLWSIMRSVAKAGHFGDFDKVQHQYVDTIMMELTEAIVEAERLEEQMEQNKTPIEP